MRDQRIKSTDQAHGRISGTKEHHRLHIVVVAVCFLARGVVKVVELSARGDPGGGHFFETLARLCLEGFHRVKLVNQTLKGCVCESYVMSCGFGISLRDEQWCWDPTSLSQPTGSHLPLKPINRTSISSADGIAAPAPRPIPSTLPF
jgi:hypothetical protein